MLLTYLPGAERLLKTLGRQCFDPAACLADFQSRTVTSLDSLQDKSGLCGHRSLIECQMLPKGASDSSPRVVHGHRSLKYCPFGGRHRSKLS